MSLPLEEKYIPIVLCAGFGTRLKPLTDFIPKVVCPLIDKPFAFYNIEKLFKAGFHTVHCNTHYLSDIVKTELIEACKFFGYDPNRIRFWHEEEILETGGGITRIFQGLCQENSLNINKDIIVVSGDIVADFPLEAMISRWEIKNERELALLCTRNMAQFRKDATYVNQNLTQVLGFGEKFATSEENNNCVAKVFTNHQIVSGSVVKKCAVQKKSSIDLFYREIINNKNEIINFDYSDSLSWFNIGTPQEYFECIQHYLKDKDLSSIENYSFHIPHDLQEKIDLYLGGYLEIKKESKNKIIISFRNRDKNCNKSISLNAVCHKLEAEDIIYLSV